MIATLDHTLVGAPPEDLAAASIPAAAPSPLDRVEAAFQSRLLCLLTVAAVAAGAGLAVWGEAVKVLGTLGVR